MRSAGWHVPQTLWRAKQTLPGDGDIRSQCLIQLWDFYNGGHFKTPEGRNRSSHTGNSITSDIETGSKDMTDLATAPTTLPTVEVSMEKPPLAEAARSNIPEFVRASEQLMLIGGRRVAAASGQTLPNTDPATEQPLARIPRGEAADVDAAVQAAKTAFTDPSWAGMTPGRRCQILNQIADVIEQNADELGSIDWVNMGAPRTLTTGMLAEASEILRYCAGWPTKIFGTTVPLTEDRVGYTRKDPLGVVGLIWGWNGPMGQLPGKLAPALAAGNTIVLKPAEAASLSTLRLVELLTESTDLPPGVLNVVTGLGSEAGEALVGHPDVAKISFTGSTATGKHVQTLANRNAQARHTRAWRQDPDGRVRRRRPAQGGGRRSGGLPGQRRSGLRLGIAGPRAGHHPRGVPRRTHRGDGHGIHTR